MSKPQSPFPEIDLLSIKIILHRFLVSVARQVSPAFLPDLQRQSLQMVDKIEQPPLAKAYLRQRVTDIFDQVGAELDRPPPEKAN